ncbi:effector-associated constant component EACC1 [Streptomyces sp. NPDC001091]
MGAEILIALASSGVLSSVARAAYRWVQSRHADRVTVTVGDQEVSLDLSNREEAAQYLKTLTEPGSEGRRAS